MRLVNLTPHDIMIDGMGTVPVSGIVARIKYDMITFDALEGVVVYEQTKGVAVDLPPPQDDTYFIVSSIVRMAIGRYDLVSPTNMIRDEHKRIIGCHALVVGGSNMLDEYDLEGECH